MRFVMRANQQSMVAAARSQEPSKRYQPRFFNFGEEPRRSAGAMDENVKFKERGS